MSGSKHVNLHWISRKPSEIFRYKSFDQGWKISIIRIAQNLHCKWNVIHTIEEKHFISVSLQKEYPIRFVNVDRNRKHTTECFQGIEKGCVWNKWVKRGRFWDYSKMKVKLKYLRVMIEWSSTRRYQLTKDN